MTVNLDLAHNDQAIIERIVDRLLARAKDLVGEGFTPREDERAQLCTSLAACHLNGCPLDLPKLYGTTDGNLAHDVFGIDKHISTETGKLTLFRPRCAL